MQYHSIAVITALDCIWSYKHIRCYVSVSVGAKHDTIRHKDGVIEPTNSIKALGPGQFGRQFASNILRCVFSRGAHCILISNSIKFFPSGQLSFFLTIQITISYHWRQTGDKPLRGLWWPAPWWRHQMETFSASPALCAGNSPVTGEFPSQRPVTRSFDVFFDLHLNKRLSKQSWVWWFEAVSLYILDIFKCNCCYIYISQNISSEATRKTNWCEVEFLQSRLQQWNVMRYGETCIRMPYMCWIDVCMDVLWHPISSSSSSSCNYH